LPKTVAWIVGYIHKDFFLAFYGWLGGLILSLLVGTLFIFRKILY
jgi:hypothetical protein